MNDEAKTPADTASATGKQGQQSEPQKGEKFQKAMEAMKQSAEERGQTSKTKDELPPEKKEEGDTPSGDWEKRYKDLQAEKDRQVSETSKQAEELAKNLIEKDPNYIHTLGEKNKALADKIIKSDRACKEAGIKDYDDLVSYLEKKDMPESDKKVLSKVEELEKKVAEQGQKLTDKEKREAELFITQFKEQHPEFKGEVEKKTWELFNKSDLTLEECFDFMKYKEGIQEDVNKREAKAWENLQSKKMAGAIPSTGSRGSDSKKTKINPETRDFLEGIGAKKTLSKYGS